jgi:hypothetical protein
MDPMVALSLVNHRHLELRRAAASERLAASARRPLTGRSPSPSRSRAWRTVLRRTRLAVS